MARRPLLLGHRGARATASIPENTFASFDLCLQHGCDGFEFDVRGTADGIPVVCHDEVFRGITLAQTSASDLAPWQTQGFLPTLESVLRTFAPRAFLDIEIKDPGLESQVLDLLHRYPPAHGSVVTSFRPEVLHRLREFDPAIQLGFIWDRNPTPWRILPLQWALPERRLLTRTLAAELLSAGNRVGTWTVNHSADMLHLAALGAELLISDDTAGLVNTFPVV
jgi:glycerophosphoryl diester phosphodiesterase